MVFGVGICVAGAFVVRGLLVGSWLLRGVCLVYYCVLWFACCFMNDCVA